MNSIIASKHSVFLRFSIGVAAALLLIGLIRTWHSPFALDIDGAEQMYLSQWLELGFGIQPPLPTWLLNGMVYLFGHSSATVQCMRLATIFFIYAGMFRLGLMVLRNQALALLSTLSLVLVLQFSSEMLRQMHTVFVTLSVVYAWIVILKIHANGRAASYLWLGVWIGIGLLSKYNFALHILVVLAVVLGFASFRKKLGSPKIALTILVALMISLPHYWWLADHFMEVSQGVNNDLATSGDASIFRSLVDGLGAFFVSLASFLGALTVVVVSLFRKQINMKGEKSVEIQFFERYILISLCALLCIVIVTKADVFHEHWLQPFLILFPIVLFDKVKGVTAIDQFRVRPFIVLCTFVFLVISLNFAFKSGIRVVTGDRNSVFNVPYNEVAAALENRPQCEIILTKDVRTAGHLKMLLPDRLILVEHDLHHLNIERARLLNSSKAVFLWKVTNQKGKIPLNRHFLRSALGENISIELGITEFFNLNYLHTEDQPYNVGVATITVRETE